jgi:hypothetical protein
MPHYTRTEAAHLERRGVQLLQQLRAGQRGRRLSNLVDIS